MPSLVTVKANIEGFAVPIERSAGLVEYKSDTPSGGVAFPGKNIDLDPGEYWIGEHGHTKSQRYAYDFVVRRRDGNKWTTLKPLKPNAKVSIEDHLIFGKPVYAVADGTIVRCRRSEIDHPLEVNGSGGGNCVIQQLKDGTFVSYYHLKHNSVPSSLCPMEGHDGDDWTPLSIPVSEGDRIGAVGNTGRSSGPHLHIHLTDSAEPDGVHTRGLPLRFHNIIVREPYDEGDTGKWTFFPPTKSAVPYKLLIYPETP